MLMSLQVALPPNWEELEDEEGNVYFYDKATGKSSIKHPMDDYFFALVQVATPPVYVSRNAALQYPSFMGPSCSCSQNQF